MRKPQAWILAVFTLVVLAILIAAIFAEFSQTEVVFISILLALFSAAASWLATSMHSQRNITAVRNELREEYQDNLRMYARKAAEKVQSLTDTIDRLRNRIRDATERPAPPPSEQMVEDQRWIAHELETLRTMNQNTLSDWRGIIGSDLETQARIEKSLWELVKNLERVESLGADTEEQLAPYWAQVHDLTRVLNASGPIPLRVPQMMNPLLRATLAEFRKRKPTDLTEMAQHSLTYRIFAPEREPKGLHYEFIAYSGGSIGAEIHIEESMFSDRDDLLSKLAEELKGEFVNARVRYDPGWSHAGGRLIVRYGSGTAPSEVASGMLHLIELTRGRLWPRSTDDSASVDEA